MRFSLLSILLLTFWIALGTQVYLGRQRLATAVAEEKKAEAEIASLRAEIDVWTAQELPRQAAVTERELAELEQLKVALVNAFQEEADSLSQLKPHPELVSIRTMPVMELSRRTYQSVKISVPETRPLALQMYLRDKDAAGRGEEPEASPPPLAVAGLQGEHPLTVPLSAGVHLIECLYDYRDEQARPYFLVKIDGEEVGRLICPDDRSGYSSSRTNWLQQQDLAADRRLPVLLSVSPSGLEGEIAVRLIERQP